MGGCSRGGYAGVDLVKRLRGAEPRLHHVNHNGRVRSRIQIVRFAQKLLWKEVLVTAGEKSLSPVLLQRATGGGSLTC